MQNKLASKQMAGRRFSILSDSQHLKGVLEMIGRHIVALRTDFERGKLIFTFSLPGPDIARIDRLRALS